VTRVLGIDTASARFALALAEEGRIVRSLVRDEALDHSQLLLPAIKEILGQDRTLHAIAVVKGPGSYAGLRVGIATAQGLALALGIPLVGVGTLEAVAAASGLDDVTAVHPAGRGELAVQQFAGGEAQGEPYVAAPGDAGPPPFAGEGAATLGGREVPPGERCRAALLLALARLAEGEPADFEPTYVRQPSFTPPRRSAMSRAARSN
jgi:tRNA threonylcarbamoyladenosine biosynthesis protein TsaB